MGLINYKTSLKSLKFGKDRPGGGSSNQPYIKTPTPDEGNNIGGTGSLLEKGSLLISRSATDVSRLTKYFTDSKSYSGSNFIINQNLLSRQSADITAGTKKYKEFSFAGGIYTPLNTIMQVGEVGFGAHYKKQGIATNGGLLGNAIGFIDSELNLNIADGLIQQHEYIKVTKDPNNSRLKNLYMTKGYNPEGINLDTLIPTTKIDQYKNYVNDLISPTGLNVDGVLSSLTSNVLDRSLNIDGNVLYEYNGGPNLTKTKIIRYVDTRHPQKESGRKVYSKYKKDIEKNYLPLNLLSLKFLKGTEAITYNKVGDSSKALRGVVIKKRLEKITSNGGSEIQEVLIGGKSDEDFRNIKDIASNEQSKKDGFPKIVDFRNLIDPRFPSWGGIKLYDSNNNGIARIGMNDPSHRLKSLQNRSSDQNYDAVHNFSKSDYTVDEINKSSILGKNNKGSSDLIKFRIGVLGRDGSVNNIQFRAYIDSFDDNYQSDWTEQSFMGRGEKFYKYNGFNRDINLSFTVAALSKPELIPMYKKLNYLASILAPDYGTNGYMSGNLVTLTLGGYLYEVPGVIQGLSIAPHEESSWEIGLRYNGEGDKGWDNEVKELPMTIKVTGFKFKPIHEFTPKIQKNYERGKVRFISLSNGENNNYDN